MNTNSKDEFDAGAHVQAEASAGSDVVPPRPQRLSRRRALKVGAAGAAAASAAGVAGVVAAPAAGAATVINGSADVVSGGTPSAPGATISLRQGTLGQWIFSGSPARAGELGLVTDYGWAVLGGGTGSPSFGTGLFVSAYDTGAKGDGTTDDTAAINAAITRASGLGGGTVFLPAGTYKTTGSINMASNVRLTGAGRAATTLVQTVDTASVVECDSVTDIEVSDLGILGQATYTNGGHGVRFSGVTRGRLVNLHIQKVSCYGIGMEVGQMKDILIEGCLIENTGADGIDTKDHTFTNDGLVIDRCTVRSPGVAPSSQNVDRKGIDVRGLNVVVSNCIVENPAANDTAIIARYGEALSGQGSGDGEGGSNGIGAHHAVIVNCVVVGGANAGTCGFQIDGKHVMVSNCVAKACNIGFLVTQVGAQLSNCQAVDTTGTGFFFQTNNPPFPDKPTQADRCMVVNCASLLTVPSSTLVTHFRVATNQCVFQSCLVDTFSTAVTGSAPPYTVTTTNNSFTGSRGVLFLSGAANNKWLNGSLYGPPVTILDQNSPTTNDVASI